MATVISAILGIVAVLTGGYLVKIKAVIKEFSDIPESIESALSDNKITADELKNVLKQVHEFVSALKLLIKFK